MAQVFQINGTNLTYITKGDWEDRAVDDALDGVTVVNRFRRHILSTNIVMSASEFDTLYALRGQRVTLTTTDYDDRNGDYKTYYEATFEKLSGLHDGPIFLNVQAEFQVRL